MVLRTLLDCLIYAFLISVPLLPLLYMFTLQVSETIIQAFKNWLWDDDYGHR